MEAPNAQPERPPNEAPRAEGSWMVSCVVAEELPGVTELGWKLAVAPVGKLLAEKLTGLVYEPFCAVTVMVYLAEPAG
jgi:hypothetical protein